MKVASSGSLRVTSSASTRIRSQTGSSVSSLRRVCCCPMAKSLSSGLSFSTGRAGHSSLPAAIVPPRVGACARWVNPPTGRLPPAPTSAQCEAGLQTRLLGYAVAQVDRLRGWHRLDHLELYGVGRAIEQAAALAQ